MGLAAFFIAVLSGLMVDNPADVILGRALVAMIVCCVMGSVLGSMAERAVSEHLSERAEALTARLAFEAAGKQPGSNEGPANDVIEV